MNNKISQKQGILMVVMFIIGSSSLMVMGLEAKNDIWIAILLAGAASVLIMLIYAKLLSVLPNKDFYETLEFFLGKVGSKIVIFLLTWFCFDLCAIVLRNYGQFVITVGLPETPIMVAMLTIIILCAFAVKSGIEVLGRWTESFVLFVIAFLIISVVLLTKNMEINNLLPIYDNGLKPILKGTLGVITFPFAETVVFLLVFPAFKKGVSVKKVFLKGLALGGITILITSLADLLVLGCSISENMYYPTYSAFATTHFGDFIHRLESFAAIVFIVAVFLKVSILLFGAVKGTSRLLGFKNQNFIIIPIMLLVLNFALFSFDSMMYYHEWVFKIWPYYAPVFEIIIPLIVLIIIQIRLKTMKTPLPATQT